MKTALKFVVSATLLLLLAGCVYEPGYVRSDGYYGGDAYYGTTYYDDGYYASPYYSYGYGYYPSFQHIGILSLEFHVDKLSRPLL